MFEFYVDDGINSNDIQRCHGMSSMFDLPALPCFFGNTNTMDGIGFTCLRRYLTRFTFQISDVAVPVTDAIFLPGS